MVQNGDPNRGASLEVWARWALLLLGGVMIGFGISLFMDPPRSIEFAPRCAAADCVALVDRDQPGVVAILIGAGTLLALIALNGRRIGRR